MANATSHDGNGGAGFDVHDIGLASALLSLGHELITVHPDEDCGCTVFHFEPTPQLEKDAEAYMKGKLSVNAKSYCQAFEYIGEFVFGGQHDKD